MSSLAGLANDPEVVAHRIVHGGDVPGAVDLTDERIAALAKFSAWAPLHQPPALALVAAARARWPLARQIGMFDTCFHQTLPEAQRYFALPHALHALGIKRYGFHGLAFQSALRKLCAAEPDLAAGRVVLAHLGGGSSICASLDGRSVATSMGMTPLAGVPMATRSGSLDPGVLLHLQRQLQLSPPQIDQLLWKDSGLKGISGESADMRVLLACASPRAELAIEIYVNTVAETIAAHAVSIAGIDALVFSGGIGANAWQIRDRIAQKLQWLGVTLDAAANRNGVGEISRSTAPLRSFVVAVDEAYEIAEAVASFVSAH